MNDNPRLLPQAGFSIGSPVIEATKSTSIIRAMAPSAGANGEFVARILTAATSLRQQGREVMEYLTGVCQAAISQTVPKRLIPNSS